jgi:uncharacterized protein (DUF2126 family)
VDAELLQELRAQDAALRARELDLWIGAEPTFTDRRSSERWWLVGAEGGDKRERARALLVDLARRLRGAAALLAVPGRQFPGEPAPRFALALRFRRDAAPGPDATRDPAELDRPPRAPAPLAPGEALLTVTPDPGVVEVNSAPAPGLEVFHREAEATYAAAEACGLSPERFRFNGRAADSGGGGQLTLGGPSPAASPFFRHPTLLPRLVRYLTNHPALSYAFAGECLGSASQGPRPDEGVRERFEELQLALDRLEARGERVEPRELWEALAPLLVDASGNSHRAELNVEKLWNPWLPRRGELGLVELRALRMPRSAAHLAAVAALFRAVTARLVVAPYDAPLADFGGALHGRLALPSALAVDLRAILDDLAERGVGLGPALRALVLERPEPMAEVALGDATLVVSPAVEFWPLLGDVASQERAPARLVDASCERVEISVTAPPGSGAGRVGAAGWELPLEPIEGGWRHVAGVRFRAFTPRPGLHPGLAPTDPLVITWERGGERLALELHGWIPGGGVYPGLPEDAEEARRRRRERVRVTRCGAQTLRRGGARGGLLDLRRLDGPGAARRAGGGAP